MLYLILCILIMKVEIGDHFKIIGLFHEGELDLQSVLNLTVQNNQADFEIQTELVSKTDTFTLKKQVCNLLATQPEIIAIFGPTSLATSSMAQSICSSLQIPHVGFSWNPRPPRNLNFFPDADVLALGLAKAFHSLNWKNFAVLYESDGALLRLQRIVEGKKSSAVYRKLQEDFDNRIILKELVNTTINNIILDCQTSHILDILQQAKELTLLDSFHNFFLTSLDAHTLNFDNTFANITMVSLVDLNKTFFEQQPVKTDVALIHDSASYFMDSILEFNKDQEIIPRSFNCGENDTWEYGIKITDYMNERLDQYGITGPIKFNGNGSRIGFKLNVLELVNGQLIKTAEWDSDNPDSVNILRTSDEQEQQALESLQKHLVIVSSRIGPPYLMRRKKSSPDEILTGNDEFEGYSLDLIDAIAKELNFTYLFKITKNNVYGKLNPVTKKWDGLIGDLLDHKAHLAICDLTITYQRRQVVDFSSPFMDLGIAIVYKEEPEEEQNIFKFMLPLSVEVWIYTISAYLVVSATLFFVARMAPEDWENPHPCEDNPEELENIWNVKNCMWFTMGSLMTQGCDLLPKAVSSRMSATMWWFFCLLMTSSYTANLAAFLATQNMGPGIDSAEALSKQTKIKYGLLEGGATEAFFRESNFSTYKRMWAQMQSFKPSVFEKNNPDGVKRVLNSKETSPYAFLMESSSIEYETASKCTLKAIGEPLDSKSYGIAMPMDAKYRSAINKVILSMQELGNLTRLKTKWWKDMIEGGACPEKEEPENTLELGLANVGGVFVVLSIGISIAFLIAIFEFLWNVVDVAVQEQMSYREALIAELRFVVNVRESRKAVNHCTSDGSSNSERHSIVKEGVPLEEIKS